MAYRDPQIQHLLRRAGFGATAGELDYYTNLGMGGAIDELVGYTRVPDDVDSKIGTPGYAGTTSTGEFSPSTVINDARQRWLFRMTHSRRPLQEKMTVFWHNHFATAYSKLAGNLNAPDPTRMLAAKKSEHPGGLRGQIELFRDYALGNFRDLLVEVAKDPAMLVWLDGRSNFKARPQENFAREIMELFTMGVGHYTEKDIREAARAFTGWNYVDVKFVVNKDQHDDSEKTFLGKTGRFDGLDVIDIIMQQPATADYIAGKIYRFFVRQELSPELQKQLGSVLRQSNYEIAPLLEKIFLSRDFYSSASVGTQIKGPVELAVSTYRKLGLHSVPGVPDFNLATAALGQQLFSPPTVAGWAGGQSWITPGLLLERGNFARDILFPDISFLPPDRFTGGGEIRRVADRIRQGMDITTATMDDTKNGVRAESNLSADRDEEFNTRYGSFRGSQLAIERVKPIPRDTAQVNLAPMVLGQNLKNTPQAVDYLIHRFMRVPPDDATRQKLIAFLNKELGTTDLSVAQTYLEEPLRLVLHLIMSQPEYQLS